MSWEKVLLDERQQKELEFCRTSEKFFNHGTDGHNAKVIIARLANFIAFLALQLGDDEFPAMLEKWRELVNMGE